MWSAFKLIPIFLFLIAVSAFAGPDSRILADLFVDSKPVDHYKVLGIEPNANDMEIKKAYRRAAMRTHPDHAGEASKEEFQRVKRAYEVLTDPKRRATFDQFFSRKQSAPKPKPKVYSYEWAKPDPQPQPKTRAGEWNSYTQAQKTKETPRPKPKPTNPFKHVPEYLLWDGGLPNYFAVAGVPVNATREDAVEGIAKRRASLKSALAAAANDAERADIRKRLLRLDKAEEILMNRRTTNEYLDAARKVWVRNVSTGKLETFADQLERYVPQGYVKKSAPRCGSWFDIFT